MNILDGKVIVVTGAGGGVGKAIAVEAARQGAQVVVNDIQKNKAHGYISAPKYSPEDLNAGATVTPGALKSSVADSPEPANVQ